MPTPAQLKAEIESGPLAAELAPLWAAGNDAAVLALLNDPTKRTRLVPPTLSLTELATEGGFAQASVAAVFNHPRFPDFNLAVNNQNAAGAVAIATLFAGLGVVTAEDLAAFTTYATTPVEQPCSRLAELGWRITQDDVNRSRGAQ